MTFEEYIKNPMGNKSAVIVNREMYRTMYNLKYEKVMLREGNKVTYHVYKHKEEYYFYILVPSEVIPDFYYDVVIKFIPNKTSALETSLKNYDVQFYANDPRFVFTFAHAFIKEGLFIKELESRMSRQAVREKPKQTNPKEEIAYVKSLYFAYLIMKDKGLFNKLIITPMATSLNIRALEAQITPADKKIEARQEEQNKINASKKKEKIANAEDIKKDIKQLGDEAKNTNSSIRKVGIIGSANKGKSHMIKPISKIRKIGK